MIRLSSSLTLAIVLFLPVIWFVFFGSLTLFILATDPEDLPFTNATTIKMSMVASFLFFGFIIYKSLMKLKRVELEDTQLFVTNYFKTITLPVTRISKISEHRLFGIILVTLVVDNKSMFGRKIRFISDEEKFRLLLSKHEYLKTRLE